jgi:putative flippase GtrA
MQNRLGHLCRLFPFGRLACGNSRLSGGRNSPVGEQDVVAGLTIGETSGVQGINADRAGMSEQIEQAGGRKKSLMDRIKRFAFAGATGFVVDASVLLGLTVLAGVDPFSARIVAITTAAFVTWQINRNFTWAKAKDGAAREGVRYASVVLTAAAINYAVYSGALLLIAGLWPFIALCIGTGTAMIVSFFGFDRFAFKR